MTTLRPAPSRTREGHIPGEPGLWIMLLGDMVVFAVFFGTILVLHGKHQDMFKASQPALHQGLGATNTLVLLTSSLLVANGVTIESGAQSSFTAVANKKLTNGSIFIAINNTSANPISGAFANLPDGSTFTAGRNNYQVSYEGGDGNDLTLTVAP